jgi:hypothetical protein
LHSTRCQRAREGAEQSPARGGDHVIQRARVRLLHVRLDAVVFGDLAVDPEQDRLLLLRRQVGSAAFPSTGSTFTRETYFTSDTASPLVALPQRLTARIICSP